MRPWRFAKERSSGLRASSARAVPSSRVRSSARRAWRDAARFLGRWARGSGPERLRRVGIVFPFLALFLTLSLASSSFATKVNMLNILDQQSATLIIAAAGTLVLVAGGIDLSLGATYSVAGVPPAHFAQTQ